MCALVTGVQTCALPISPAPATRRLLQRAMKTFSQGARVWPRPAIRARPATNQRGTGMTTDTGRRNVIKLLGAGALGLGVRSEEHTSELQSLMRISYAVFCLKKTKKQTNNSNTHTKLKNIKKSNHKS